MSILPPSLQMVIDGFSRFPGIGPKTAQRLAFHVLKTNDGSVQNLANALLMAKENIKNCLVCHNITEESPCGICRDERRDKQTVCVVENPADIILLEKTQYRGQYHVLGGVLSPLDGIGPGDLNIDSLLERCSGVTEIIVATNTSIEGDTTALYLSEILQDKGIKVSRLARGLPVGGHLEYVDEATLLRSINERVEIR